MGTPLPACQGNMSLVSSRVRWLAPALPRPTDPSLTNLQWLRRAHLVGFRWRAALLGSPVLLPGHHGVAGGSLRHPAGRRKGVGVGKGEALAKRLGAAGLPGVVGKDVGCARGLLAASVLLPWLVAVPPDTAGWGLQPHLSHAAQWGVTKGPTVTRRLGRVGQGVPWGGTGPAQPWAPGALMVPPGPPLPSRPRGTSLSPPQCVPMFRHPGVLPGRPFPLQSPASAP